jgi:G3E family GTPase
MKLFLAGGFLGSGKTTAIQQAVTYLQQNNKRAGVITNDQGDQQVDTLFIKSNNIPAQEVANSCFCCNYPALEKGIQTLQLTNNVEIVFAEAVGSCTDLAATIINPLLAYNPGVHNIVLSVFADIRLLVAYLQNDKRLFFDDVTYIYQKQLEEADIIIVNKIDLVTPEQLAHAEKLIATAYPNKKILYQNSLLEQSVKSWVDTLLTGFNNTNLRPVPAIDYDTYGNGEAQVTWFDEDITITTIDETAANAAYALIDKIYTAIAEAGYAIGHLKFFINTGQQQAKISFTALHTQPVQRTGYIKTKKVSLLVNARVQVGPGILKTIVAKAIAETVVQAACTIIENKINCFVPGYPRPTHRIAG